MILLVIEREGKPGLMSTKPNKNVHVIRKQQRRHTIADQTSLSFIKPTGLWKQSRRQSMFKNTLPTVSKFVYVFYFEFNDYSFKWQ